MQHAFMRCGLMKSSWKWTAIFANVAIQLFHADWIFRIIGAVAARLIFLELVTKKTHHLWNFTRRLTMNDSWLCGICECMSNLKVQQMNLTCIIPLFCPSSVLLVSLVVTNIGLLSVTLRCRCVRAASWLRLRLSGTMLNCSLFLFAASGKYIFCYPTGRSGRSPVAFH